MQSSIRVETQSSYNTAIVRKKLKVKMRPTEEIAAELYKKYGPGSKEAIVGFTFDLGEISDPVYGTASNLRGELPFPLAPGEFILPEILGQPEILQKYAEKLLPHCREAFPDLLDEEIIVTLKNNGLGFALLNPDATDANLLQFSMLIGAFVFVFDDTIDSQGPDDIQMFTYKSLQGLCDDVIAKSQESSSEVWAIIPGINASIQGAKTLGKLAVGFIEHNVPNFLKTLFASPWVPEFKSNLQAVYAIKEHAHEGKYYSKTTVFELYRYVPGNRMSTEAAMVYRGLKIPSEIRSDILFQIALNNFADIIGYYNAILGLERDIRKKQEQDSPLMYLVTVQKKSLQEAFDEVYRAMTDAFDDYIMNTKKLLEVYEDGSLKKYVELMNFYMAGNLCGYKIAARYGVQEKMNVATKRKHSAMPLIKEALNLDEIESQS